jgi:hypothetical protein
MNIKTYIAAAVLALATAGSATAKNVMTPKMYMFGFAASFNDSIVHFTDIIDVDSAWVSSKGNFLLGRNLYSSQLRDYLTSCLLDNRVCVVVYDQKRKRLEKKLLKMRKRYSGSKARRGYDVRTIEASDFRFKPVNMGYYDDNPVTEGDYDYGE